MLVAFLIMLREGIEASLIVSIVASYLVKTGRRRYLGAVWAGVAGAMSLCVAIGYALHLLNAEFPQRQQELFEAGIALVAVAILTSMVFWMKSAAQSIKSQLYRDIDASIASGGATVALVAMAFLAVGREGLESVFFLLAIFEQSTGWAVPTGAALGLLSAVAIGFLLYWGGIRLNLRRFFRVTGVFIVFVAAGLLAAALRSAHEAGLWNGLQAVVVDWSNLLPADGPVGTVLAGMFGYTDHPSLGEVLVYFAYLVPVLILFLLPTRTGYAVPSRA